ncbi:ATP-dependent RNA helicase HrpA [Oceanisphaera psychrotolerans]|uniref:RNA helicase n=1 Tax=Oceanisphaera psychrotolerans TaxID=1414654 RepID=A0A1J4Q9L3_9GAMM|nr:ATP-dependent RNA helicase HrpA [Oceanisphaera psychrotolerans]OIN04528.1 ATP-dependent RNA helicase HrpA [Oceanisphaera psychrotolerans]
MTQSVEQWQAKLKECRGAQRGRFRRRLQGLAKLSQTKQEKVLANIAAEMTASSAERRRRQALLEHPIHYPPQLPVSEKRDTIKAAIRDHQVVIIAGETGSGKTTQIPKMCLELGLGIDGTIGHTQPRRLAARSVATRLAQELECELGQRVGYKVRFNDQVSEGTQVKLMTDGILLAEIQQDRMLRQYDTIIIDEAHERSLNIDFIMGYLKQLLPKRPDLKVIITSATIDPERFSRHFNEAPIISVSGRTYPVELRYRPLVDDNRERDQLQGIFDAVTELTNEGPGDILIFMNGEREIRDTADALNKLELRHTEIVPLYSRLSNAEQNRIFESHSGRRIVLATNVAETSLTVPGIRYVIDPGTARISRYSYRTKVQRLPIEPVSQASANQRMGRCGRVEAGICIRLYGEDDFLSRPEFTDPEILRTNLASVILQMLSLGLGDISAFPFVEAPDRKNISDGIRLLEELGAVTGDQGSLALTPLGGDLARLPVDPRLARMVLAARQHGCVTEVMVITAALSIQDPRERPLDKQQAAAEMHRRFADKDSDFVAYINLWNHLKEQQKALSGNQFRKQCIKEFLNYLRVREWQDIYSQLRLVVRELGFPLNSEPADYNSLHQALLTGMLSQVGMRDGDKKEIVGARNARFVLVPGSSLAKKPPRWLMVAELTETHRLYGRTAARLELDWLEDAGAHLLKSSYSEPYWSKKQGAVMGYLSQSLFGLPVVVRRRVNYGQVDPKLCRELFIRQALVEGELHTRHEFFHHNRALLEQAEALEHKSRRRDLVIDDDTLFRFYDERLPADIVSIRHFDNWWKLARKDNPELLHFTEEMLLNERADKVTTRDYPDAWQHDGLNLALDYQFEPGQDDDGVTVRIPLPLLNQVEPAPFRWQVPGLRRELVIGLIKSLPKPMRKHFVPAPNFAEALLAAMSPLEGELLDQMEKHLRRMTGVTVPREDWDWQALPAHLIMRFCVLDADGKVLAAGRDLEAIKLSLQGQVQTALTQAVDDDRFEQEGLLAFPERTIPQTYAAKRAGFEVKAYPALSDQGDSVALTLCEDDISQARTMWDGQSRLLLLQLPSPIKYLHEKLPNKAKLGLYFNPYGKVLDLVDDCIRAGVHQLMRQHGAPAWTPEAFAELKDKVAGELNQAVAAIALQVEEVLSRAHGVKKRLKGKIDLALAMAMSDIQAQLDGLIFRGFVTDAGAERLGDLGRYLEALSRRLDKLAIDPHRDRAHLLKIQQVQQAYQALLKKQPRGKPLAPEVAEIRWMIEELRVSYFAQTLGTPYPISDKRIVQQINSL